MARFAASIELAKQSWAALQQNRQLIAFPIISMLGMVIATALFFVPLAAIGAVTAVTTEGELSRTQVIASLAVLFFYYLVTYTIVIFSNTALIGATMRLARGQPATVGDGIQIS